jgi:DNA uptake protein ComE-like DNA-binding protein
MSKKLVMLFFALVLSAALSFAQTAPASSNSGQSASTDTTTTTTTTKKTVHHAKKSTAASTAESGTAAAGEKLDINTATKEQLEALPGIGDKYSQKIIDGRPYRAKSDLVSKHILPRSVYDKVKADIIAHRSSTATASSKATTK